MLKSKSYNIIYYTIKVLSYFFIYIYIYMCVCVCVYIQMIKIVAKTKNLFKKL